MSSLTTPKERIPVLDGLRFIAAFSVMVAHYTAFILADQGVQSKWTFVLSQLSGIGMPLFFVLSGFVIHYNYHRMREEPKGIRNYLIARFTRLYPLYILLFVIEFIIAFHCERGSCAHAGDKCGLFLALPYYLTLTQDWIYGIIGTNSLVYQYSMVSAVSWSISLEAFFYLFYILITRWLFNQKNWKKQLLFASGVQILLIFYFLFCERHIENIEHIALIGFGKYATIANGYQDSLFRWLNYFNPLANLPAFFFGAVVAQLYLMIKDKPLSRVEEMFGGWFCILSVLLTFFTHSLLYGYLAPTTGFFGRTASSLDVPMFAVMLFCQVRYRSTFIPRLLAKPFLVKLGEASFSIYLLHAFFAWYPRDFYHLKLNPWLLYVISMGCILLISRLSYVLFEMPVQKWLRRKMGERPTPKFSKDRVQAVVTDI